MEENHLYQLLEFLKALGDHSRLRIITLLSRQAYTVEQLAAILSLSPSTVSHHLGRLVEAGLVHARGESYYNLYSLDNRAIEQRLNDLLTMGLLPGMAPGVDEGAYDRQVVANFTGPEGRLTTIPAQRKKLEAVLRFLAQKFEPGLRYSESQVNAILGRYHADTATLRRELVGYRLINREAGQYWRNEELNEKESTMDTSTIEQDDVMNFFRTLIDADRLTIAGLLNLQPRTAAELAALMRKKPQDISRQMGMLVHFGLVKAEGEVYSLNTSHLEGLARKVLSQESNRLKPQDFEGEAYDRKVLADFSTPDGRLKALPSQQKKLLVILRSLAPLFEPGVEYTEKQVNLLLSEKFADTASLRRYLVDFGFLKRERGIYTKAEPQALP